MMYKIIYDNLIIDVIDNPRYMRYMVKSGRMTITDKQNAHCVISSNNKELYLLQGVTRPEGKEWKEVTMVEITQNEYNELFKLIASNRTIYANKNELSLVRNEKISELSSECHKSIINGISVLFSDNKYHKFDLTIEDQLNLLSLENEIKNGAKEVLYHEKNNMCKLYSSTDIEKLIMAAHDHKVYHTTYFNILKDYINSLYDINIIKDIYYGIELPYEYNDTLQKLLK